ncbi:hypothetical protein DUNSADRAFT_10384, partial [Dunaliella salina]
CISPWAFALGHSLVCDLLPPIWLMVAWYFPERCHVVRKSAWAMSTQCVHHCLHPHILACQSVQASMPTHMNNKCIRWSLPTHTCRLALSLARRQCVAAPLVWPCGSFTTCCFPPKHGSLAMAMSTQCAHHSLHPRTLACQSVQACKPTHSARQTHSLVFTNAHLQARAAPCLAAMCASTLGVALQQLHTLLPPSLGLAPWALPAAWPCWESTAVHDLDPPSKLHSESIGGAKHGGGSGGGGGVAGSGAAEAQARQQRQRRRGGMPGRGEGTIGNGPGAGQQLDSGAAAEGRGDAAEEGVPLPLTQALMGVGEVHVDNGVRAPDSGADAQNSVSRSGSCWPTIQSLDPIITALVLGTPRDAGNAPSALEPPSDSSMRVNVMAMVRVYLLRAPALSLTGGRSLLRRLIGLLVAPEAPTVRQAASSLLVHGVCSRLPALLEAFGPSHPNSAAAALCAYTASTHAATAHSAAAGRSAVLAAAAAAASIGVGRNECDANVSGARAQRDAEQAGQQQQQQAEALEARLQEEVRAAERAMMAHMRALLDAGPDGNSAARPEASVSTGWPAAAWASRPAHAAAASTPTSLLVPLGCRATVLGAAAGLVGRMRVAEMAPMPLLLLLGALGRDDPGLRAAAASALNSVCVRLGASPPGLLLRSSLTPSVLEYVGSRAADQPRLLTELARLVGTEERQLAEAIVPQVIGKLCVQRAGRPLAALAALLGMNEQILFVNYAHHAIAYALWVGSESIVSFIEFVDALMSKQDDDFMTVAKVTAKDVAQQVREGES